MASTNVLHRSFSRRRALWFSILSALAAAPRRLFAQPTGSWSPKLDHLALSVRSFDSAITWYCDKLGFSVRQRWEQRQTGRKLAYLTLGATVLEIIEADQGAADRPLPARAADYFATPGYNHVCFALNNLDHALQALCARGVEVFAAPEDRALGSSGWRRRIAFFRDPEGNLIELAEPLRRS